MAEKQFRCADVGYTECDWHLEGTSEEEMVPKIEEHAFEVHHLQFKEEALENVRKSIHDVA